MEPRLVGFLVCHCVCDRLGRNGAEGLELGWRDVVERFVQAGVVEPAEVFDDGELGLEACAEDTAGDELGLQGADEALGQRVCRRRRRPSRPWRRCPGRRAAACNGNSCTGCCGRCDAPARLPAQLASPRRSITCGLVRAQGAIPTCASRCRCPGGRGTGHPVRRLLGRWCAVGRNETLEGVRRSLSGCGPSERSARSPSPIHGEMR